MLGVGAFIRRSAPWDAERPFAFQRRASERDPQKTRSPKTEATVNDHRF